MKVSSLTTVIIIAILHLAWNEAQTELIRECLCVACCINAVAGTFDTKLRVKVGATVSRSILRWRVRVRVGRENTRACVSIRVSIIHSDQREEPCREIVEPGDITELVSGHIIGLKYTRYRSMRSILSKRDLVWIRRIVADLSPTFTFQSASARITRHQQLLDLKYSAPRSRQILAN